MCIEKLLTAEAGAGSPRRLLCRGNFLVTIILLNMRWPFI